MDGSPGSQSLFTRWSAGQQNGNVDGYPTLMSAVVRNLMGLPGRSDWNMRGYAEQDLSTIHSPYPVQGDLTAAPALAQVMEQKVIRSDNVATVVFSPIRVTNELAWRIETETIHPNLPTIRPDRGRVRIGTMERDVRTGTMRFYGSGIEFPYGYLLYEDGMRAMRLAVEQINNGVLDAMTLATYEAMLTAHDRGKEHDEARIASERIGSVQLIEERFRRERLMFDIFRREATPLQVLNQYVEDSQREYNGEGNTWIFPPGVRTHLKTGVVWYINYASSGERGPANLYGNIVNDQSAGNVAVMDSTANAIYIAYTRDVDARGSIPLLSEIARYGEFFHMRDVLDGREGLGTKYQSDWRDVMVYSGDVDDMTRVRIKDALKATGRWDLKTGSLLNVMDHVHHLDNGGIRDFADDGAGDDAGGDDDSYDRIDPLHAWDGGTSIRPLRYQGELLPSHFDRYAGLALTVLHQARMFERWNRGDLAKSLGVLRAAKERMGSVTYDIEFEKYMASLRSANRKTNNSIDNVLSMELRPDGTMDLPTSTTYAYPPGLGSAAGFYSIARAMDESKTISNDPNAMKEIRDAVRVIQDLGVSLEAYFPNSAALNAVYTLPHYAPSARMTFLEYATGGYHLPLFMAGPSLLDDAAAAAAAAAAPAAAAAAAPAAAAAAAPAAAAAAAAAPVAPAPAAADVAAATAEQDSVIVLEQQLGLGHQVRERIEQTLVGRWGLTAQFTRAQQLRVQSIGAEMSVDASGEDPKTLRALENVTADRHRAWPAETPISAGGVIPNTAPSSIKETLRWMYEPTHNIQYPTNTATLKAFAKVDFVRGMYLQLIVNLPVTDSAPFETNFNKVFGAQPKLSILTTDNIKTKDPTTLYRELITWVATSTAKAAYDEAARERIVRAWKAMAHAYTALTALTDDKLTEKFPFIITNLLDVIDPARFLDAHVGSTYVRTPLIISPMQLSSYETYVKGMVETRVPIVVPANPRDFSRRIQSRELRGYATLASEGKLRQLPPALLDMSLVGITYPDQTAVEYQDDTIDMMQTLLENPDFSAVPAEAKDPVLVLVLKSQRRSRLRRTMQRIRETVADPVQRAIAFVWALTPFTWKAMEALIDNNIKLPVSVLGLRPFIQFETLTGIKILAGSDTMETLFGRPIWSWQDNGVEQAYRGTFSFMMRVVVKTERNIYVARHVLVRRLRQGFGVAPFKHEDVQTRSTRDMMYAAQQTQQPSVIFLIEPYNAALDHTITAYGRWKDAFPNMANMDPSESSRLLFTSALFAAAYWQLTPKKQSDDEDMDGEGGNAAPSLACFRGLTLHPDPDGKWTNRTSPAGFVPLSAHGRGLREAYNNPGKGYPTIDYSHTIDVGA